MSRFMFFKHVYKLVLNILKKLNNNWRLKGWNFKGKQAMHCYDKTSDVKIWGAYIVLASAIVQSSVIKYVNTKLLYICGIH